MGQAAGSPAKPQSYRTRRNRVNDELLVSIEREVLGWPGDGKGRSGSGRVLGSTIHRLQVRT